jgi:hypothetical protein
LRKLAGAFDGQKIDVTFAAAFATSIEHLPDFIKRQAIKGRTGGVSIETVGGKLKVSGAPFQRITWWIRNDEMARIQLESDSVVTLGDQYLVNGYTPLESGFTALIAENDPNE